MFPFNKENMYKTLPFLTFSEFILFIGLYTKPVVATRAHAQAETKPQRGFYFW